MASPQTISPLDMPSVDSVPVHTMQDDLDHPEEIGLPKIAPSLSKTQEVSTTAPVNSPAKKNSSSPFATT